MHVLHNIRHTVFKLQTNMTILKVQLGHSPIHVQYIVYVTYMSATDLYSCTIPALWKDRQLIGPLFWLTCW